MPQVTIDVGSNTSLLLIAEKDEAGNWSKLEETTETVRFAAEIDDLGYLSDRIINQCVSVIKEFMTQIYKHGKLPVKAAATGVLRDAKNFDQLKKIIKDRTGVSLVLLSPEEEALVSYLAVRHHCAAGGRGILTVDVGGHTTEVSWGTANTPESSESYNLGCVSLTQKYWLENRPSGATIEKVRHEIAEIWNKFRFPEQVSDFETIASGGTVTTLAALTQELTWYNAEKVHGYRLNRYEIEEMLNENLLVKSAPERVMKGVMDAKRAEVILAGALIFHELMLLKNIESITVNERGLRWGLLHFEHPEFG